MPAARRMTRPRACGLTPTVRGDIETRLLLGSACALRHYGRADATERVGLHRYTFPASDAAAVVFDLENGGCWDKATDTGFRFSDDSTRIAGWRCSTGWAKNQEVYFVAEFSKPAKGISYLQPGEIDDSKMPRIAARYARVDFDTAEGEQVLVKVALSAREVSKARRQTLRRNSPDGISTLRRPLPTRRGTMNCRR